MLSNFERHHLNRMRAEEFAQWYQLPLIKWKLPLTGLASELLDATTLDELVENEPGLWGMFVGGAPAVLTENINATKLLTNGTCGYMHSLSFAGTPPAEVAHALDAPGFSIVILEEPPLSVNFQVTLPDGDSGDGIESFVEDAVVVPVVASKHTDVYDTCSLWACLKAVPKKFRFRPHPVTLAFAVTDYKLQAQTKDELLLSIAPRPFPPQLDLKGLYVMVSRLRTGCRLRVLHRTHRSKGGFALEAQGLHCSEGEGCRAEAQWDAKVS